VLVECGFVRAIAGDGRDWTFVPSLARVAALGSPQEIVGLYVDLHGPKAEQAAAEVLAGLCEQDDATGLIGWHEDDPALDPPRPRWHPGPMPAAEQVIVARHLMRHGIVGKAKPEKASSGRFSDRFDAAEYIAAARVHLGLSAADAEALSMTEFHTLFEMKFPDKDGRGRDVPTREEYDAQMAAMKAIRDAKEKGRG
jgi:hypothetical protein